ncbi:hypothetical protein WKG86_10215 [Pantoea agglomerans]|uniref:hypothetical protein n=1 Tax=Enterobacter agglomerans TaxID=549 RepID=UPI003C7DD263
METIYSNLHKTIFLCMVSHKQTAAQLRPNDPIIEILPKGASEKQILRTAAKQRAIKHMARLAECRGFVESRGVFSVSHSRDDTVLLASYCPKVFSCGVDTEKVDVSRRIRPFMINYLEHSSCARDWAASPLLLSTIVFCCMESIYKTLSAWWPMTFSVNDYHLEQISGNSCVFNYVGVQEEIVGRLIKCRYYLHEDTVVATTFMNFQVVSL